MTKPVGYIDPYHHSPKRPWTAADSEEFMGLWEGPMSIAEIAANIKRSYGATQTRASNLCLPPKTRARRRSEDPVNSKPTPDRKSAVRVIPCISKCGRMIGSTWAGHRMCEHCKAAA